MKESLKSPNAHSFADDQPRHYENTQQNPRWVHTARWLELRSELEAQGDKEIQMKWAPPSLPGGGDACHQATAIPAGFTPQTLGNAQAMGAEFGSRSLQVTALQEMMGYEETPRRHDHIAHGTVCPEAARLEILTAQVELAAAAQASQPKALHDLGLLYLHTGHRTLGLACLERAVSRPLMDCGSMYALSGLLCVGLGSSSRENQILPDEARAVSLLEEAAAMNHRESQWALGVALCMGEALPQHVPRGIELLEAACCRSDGGLAQAQYDYGRWLTQGIYFRATLLHNPERGFKLLEQAAQSGHTAAEEILLTQATPTPTAL